MLRCCIIIIYSPTVYKGGKKPDRKLKKFCHTREMLAV